MFGGTPNITRGTQVLPPFNNSTFNCGRGVEVPAELDSRVLTNTATRVAQWFNDLIGDFRRPYRTVVFLGHNQPLVAGYLPVVPAGRSASRQSNDAIMQRCIGLSFLKPENLKLESHFFPICVYLRKSAGKKK